MATIAIIGLGSAGFAALMAVKRRDPKASVVVIDPKESDLMHPCGIPYSLGGQVEAHCLYQNVSLEKMGARRIRAAAVRIEHDRNEIIARGGEGEVAVPFEKAIIATGYLPVIPPIEGVGPLLNNGIYTLTSVDDLSRIRARAQGGPCVVIGGGAIGLEAAVAMKRYRSGVTVVEMRGQLLPGVLDPDMSKPLEEYLAGSGITLALGARVEAFHGSSSFEGVTAAGARIAGDLCILAAGFRANTTLAKESGIECDAGGILVDRTLLTSRRDVYAAGDSISGWSVIDGAKSMAKLATSAYKQGTAAGVNALGAGEEYRGTAGTFVTEVGELEVAGTGYTTAAARDHGFDPVAGKITSGILPEYFPGGKEISIKVIFDRASGRVLGAQAVGEHGAAERINIISAAIEFGIPITELPRLEMAYCPAVSEVYDPLLRAIDFGLRRVKK